VSQLRTEALALLKDGLSTHMEQQDAGPVKGDGCVARRRAAYYDQIATRGGLRDRLALTSPDGLPVAA
jgi:RNA polymerase sigma factor for flagellar operon FliA